MTRERKGLFGLVAILLIGASVWYAVRRDLYGRFLEHKHREAQIQTVHTQNKELEADIASTRQRIERLGDDPLEIETAIRQNKDLVREGERVYRIEPAPSGQVPAPTTAPETPSTAAGSAGTAP